MPYARARLMVKRLCWSGSTWRNRPFRLCWRRIRHQRNALADTFCGVSKRKRRAGRVNVDCVRGLSGRAAPVVSYNLSAVVQ